MYTPDTSEDWQSPVDTLISRSGDCEDQVILFIWLVSMYFSKQGDMAIFSVENNINHAVALIDGQYYDFNNILSNYETQEILRINYKTIMAFIEDK
jgi:predicted transglutaminase-like cysteine proteinase